MTHWTTCPECSSTQEVIFTRDPWQPLTTRQVLRRHGTARVDLCPGSGQPAPPPKPPQSGWRVQIYSREAGILQAPLRIGAYNKTQADADEQWLRMGRLRDHDWPEIAASAKYRVQYLSPEEVQDEIRAQAKKSQLDRELADAGAKLARDRRP